MKLETHVQGDVTILTPAGELISDSAAKFNQAVAEAFDRQQRDFIVNLKEITKIDSIGLETLTALQRQCDDQLGMVRFCGANETLLKVFEITRIKKQFTLNEDVDQALASFA